MGWYPHDHDDRYVRKSSNLWDDVVEKRDTVVSLDAARPSPAYRARQPRVAQVLAAFQAGHGFVKQTAGGTQADDTSVKALGTQSLRLTADTSTCFSRKSSMGPFDVSGKDIVAWFRADDPANIAEASVYLSSDNFASAWYAQFLDDATPTRPYLLPDDWAMVTWPLDNMVVAGSPNPAAINALQVRLRAATGTVTGWFGGIGLVDRSSGAVVSITFDDGYDDQYIDALPIFSRYGFPCTSYLITDLIGTSGFLTMDQCRELHTLHGWEFALHAGTSAVHEAKYPTIPEQAIVDDLALGRAWLIDNGFGEGVNHFAYPGGWYDATTLRQVRRLFASARTISEGPKETWPPADAHRLRMYNLFNTRNAAAVNAAIDDAIAADQWLILVLHRIVAPGAATQSTEYETDDLTTIAAHLATTGVPVRTVGDVVRYGV